jgi:hypothetical protein
MQKGAVNQKIIRIVGMARSGNHAIINWILAQLPGRWCFINCVDPRSSPFETARPIEAGKVWRTNIPGFDFAAERAGGLSPKDTLLFSQEDTFLKGALGPDATAIQDSAVGLSARRIDVIILRDPYNLFASRRRLSYQMVTDRTAVRIWKQHARAYLGESPWLAEDAVRVSYNDWVRDARYRRCLAERLGLVFTDAGVDAVPGCAGGSSFDGTRFDGQARRMALFDRWRAYADDPAYRRHFDTQMARLAERIFGPLPAAALLEPRRRAAPHHAHSLSAT